MAPKPVTRTIVICPLSSLLVNSEAQTWFEDHHLWRVSDAVALILGAFTGWQFLRWINELELHHGGLGFDQWNVVCSSHVACLSLEKCWLDRSRSLAAADAGHSLEARSLVSRKPSWECEVINLEV